MQRVSGKRSRLDREVQDVGCNLVNNTVDCAVFAPWLSCSFLFSRPPTLFHQVRGWDDFFDKSISEIRLFLRNIFPNTTSLVTDYRHYDNDTL